MLLNHNFSLDLCVDMSSPKKASTEVRFVKRYDIKVGSRNMGRWLVMGECRSSRYSDFVSGRFYIYSTCREYSILPF